jgi:hypothetical protein
VEHPVKRVNISRDNRPVFNEVFKNIVFAPLLVLVTNANGYGSVALKVQRQAAGLKWFYLRIDHLSC